MRHLPDLSCMVVNLPCYFIIELLGETRIIIILILLIIIRAGTPLVSHSSIFAGNQNVLIPKFNIFWIPAKVEGITDERGTSADYYYLYYYYYHYTCFT